MVIVRNDGATNFYADSCAAVVKDDSIDEKQHQPAILFMSVLAEPLGTPPYRACAAACVHQLVLLPRLITALCHQQ
jgi:hypothetical protein